MQNSSERSGLPFIGRVRYLEESYVRRVIPSLRSLELRQNDVSADSVRWPYVRHVRRAQTIFHRRRRCRRLRRRLRPFNQQGSQVKTQNEIVACFC